MKHYDVIIIGGGGGLKLRPATKLGKKVAVIEKEDLGGTCLNRGCIPSKMLIHAADVAEEIRNSGIYNLEVDQNIKVDFAGLVKRVTDTISKESQGIAESYKNMENLDFYHSEAKFIEDKVIEVNGEQLTAEYIFIAVGSRPAIPHIEGLKDTPFMTSREALRNTVQPKSMIVIGGGYIALELGHFYGALGAEVHFLVRSQMLRGQDKDIVEEFSKEFTQKYNVHMGVSPTKVSYEDEIFTVSLDNGGEMKAESLLVATGIQPNSDMLGLGNTSIKTNEQGYIQVDDRLQTSVKGVYALGDVTGDFFFRHSVNFQGEYLFRTLFIEKTDEAIKYPPMPAAVFSSPQIGTVGKTERQLIEEGADYIVGINHYKHSAMGDALRSEHGLVKILVDRKSQKLLGAHIVGKEASNMIHMLIAYMNMEATLDDMLRTIYVHPALPENIRNAARKAKASLYTKRA